MLIKNKSSQENHPKEQHKETNNDLSKVKKGKENKKKIPLAINIHSLANLTSKRTHKPSKSTIEPSENRLFNSPVINYGMNECLPNNSVSFTHILEQNLKNQQFSRHQRNPSPSVTIFQSRQLLPSNCIDHSIQSSGLSHPSMSREIGNRSKRSMQRPSKSPMRLVNPNKMSNTPKLKQKGQLNKEKSFRHLLSNHSNEEIRLQCSQKLFNKFVDSKDERGKIPQKILFCGSAKSNLLSTCAINLSQRHEKLPSLVRSSKGKISNKSVVDSSSNHQIQQFFEEDEEEESVDPTTHQKIIELKNRINRANEEMQDLLFESHPPSFMPLLSGIKFPQQIFRLNQLKQQISESAQGLIREITQLYRKASEQIENYIAVVEDSYQSSINWAKFEERLAHSDHIKLMQCQNDILMERVKQIQCELAQSNTKEQSTLNIKWSAQLSDINSSIKRISDEEAVSLSLTHRKRQAFLTITQKFNNFSQLIEQMALLKL